MKYTYYAEFTAEDKGYSISFPDLDGAFSCGDDWEDAVYMASDLLKGYLSVSKKNDEEIPTPSSHDDLTKKLSEQQQLKLIEVTL